MHIVQAWRSAHHVDRVLFYVFIGIGLVALVFTALVWQVFTYGGVEPNGALIIIALQAACLGIAVLGCIVLATRGLRFGWLPPVAAGLSTLAFFVANFLLLVALPCPSFC